MNDTNLTDRELILAVDNDPGATPRERELADRLEKQLEPSEPPYYGSPTGKGVQCGLL